MYSTVNAMTVFVRKVDSTTNFKRIAVAVQRGNAAAVLGTTPPSNSDPIFTS